ncbi:MAG: winged helix-turn-helix transcriptional regulator [Sneathiella sp.]|nr:winged helix-turn-helix transcriptional regulator [Sneathiella sp.]
MAKDSRTIRGEIKTPLDGSWEIPKDKATRDDAHLDLTTFYPYRLSILNIAVSKSISQLYADRFNLNRHEWRIIAALGDQQPLTATDIAKITSMEKMPVSRGVAKLIEDEMIEATENASDRRQKTLRLSKKGTTIYKQIVPLAQAREDYILSGLTPDEYAELNRLLGKTYEKALELQRRG